MAISKIDMHTVASSLVLPSELTCVRSVDTLSHDRADVLRQRLLSGYLLGVETVASWDGKVQAWLAPRGPCSGCLVNNGAGQCKELACVLRSDDIGYLWLLRQ